MGSSTIQEAVSGAKARYPRLDFIDFTRGIAMAVMAWDHVSNFWSQHHGGGEGILGRMPPFLNTTWFLERFVSHFCAPTFIFLAGTVLAISEAKRLERGDSQLDVLLHLIKRGFVLLFLEAFFVSPAFSMPWTYFGVIACIGVCLLVFSVARRLPWKAVLALSLLIVLNHQFLDLGFIPADPNWGWYLRVILHEPNYDRWPYYGLYPIIPWIGVMGLGWSLGSYLKGRDMQQVKRLKTPFAVGGVASVVLFFLVRWLNGYGNLLPRRGTTLVDWLYVSKYPPSVAFLLWTLGLMLIFMALGLHIQDRPWFRRGLSGVLLVFGRSPLFFYVTHLWLYRLQWPDYAPRMYVPPFYRTLPASLAFWAVGLVVLWQLCVRYERLKRRYPKPILQYI
jgi:uncharacterized membrane protein